MDNYALVCDGFLIQRALRAILPSRIVAAARRCLRCRIGVPTGDPEPDTDGQTGSSQGSYFRYVIFGHGG